MTSREVVLDGGSPWGFRMHGGADVQQPLRISRVNPGSKAALKGIREGDLITSINVQSTRDITNSDAHALLRNAGDTLKLGLNENYSGSPKRRQYKPVQETADNVKRTSATTFVSNTTNPPSKGTANNDHQVTKQNGFSDTKGEVSGNLNQGEYNGIVSQRSTISSNGSYAEHTKGPADVSLTAAETGVEGQGAEIKSSASAETLTAATTTNQIDVSSILKAAAAADNAAASKAGEPISVMADNNVSSSSTASSRSRRRRSRANRKSQTAKKQGENRSATEVVSPPPDSGDVASASAADTDSTGAPSAMEVTQESNGATPPELQTEALSAAYRVDSPEPQKELLQAQKPSKNNIRNGNNKRANGPVKSRSLDELDDQVKITEVTSEGEEQTHASEGSKANLETGIVYEVDSDVEWETADELVLDDKEPLKQMGTMSTLTLALGESALSTNAKISPEDELSLRNFLEGLNLVTSPEDASFKVKLSDRESTTHEKATAESIKAKRAKKRAALEQHFLPMYKHPRYLDVISEENSDHSDREQSRSSRNMSNRMDVDLEVGPSTSKGKSRVVVPDFSEWEEDDDDDVFEDRSKVKRRMRETKVVTCVTQIRTEPVHVVERNVIEDSTWSRGVAECSIGAEVVYLDDSSSRGDSTPSEAVEEDGAAEDTDGNNAEDVEEETDVIKEDAAAPPLVVEQSSSNTRNDSTEAIAVSEFSENASIRNVPLSQLTPPPTPDSISPKNESSGAFSETSKDAKDLKEETTLKQEEKVVSQCDTVPIMETQHETQQIREEHEDLLSKPTAKIDDLVSNGNPKGVSDTEAKTQRNIEENEANQTKLAAEIEKCILELANTMEQTDDTPQERTDPSGSPVTSMSGSMCSDSCSSRSTSQSTVRHNMVSSSPVADIMSLLHDEELALKNMLAEQPLMLKELCLQKLMALPFGAAMLEELAEVASLLDDMTSTNPSSCSITSASSRLRRFPKYSSILVKDDERPPDSNVSFILPEIPTCLQTPCDESMKSGGTTWVGLPVDRDPSVLLCLSPSQRHFIETRRSVPDEAGKLLDLHRKFIDRRGYHEEAQRRAHVASAAPTPSHTAMSENTGNRLLAIIRDTTHTARPAGEEIEARADDTSARGEMPLDASSSSATRQPPREIIHKITLEEPAAPGTLPACGSGNGSRGASATLPRVKRRDEDAFRSKYDRLRARDLSEWLQLARGYHAEAGNAHATKRRPLSDIPQVSGGITSYNFSEGMFNKDVHSSMQTRCRSQPKCPKITDPPTENPAAARPKKFASTTSLPFQHQVNDRHLQYILQKEREIELEIQNLEAEKKRLSMMDDVAAADDSGVPLRRFEPNQYYISRRGDIAIKNDEGAAAEKARPRSMPMAPSEFFRQKMYDEYMRKVAAREERKYHKVIKITSRPASYAAGDDASQHGDDLGTTATSSSTSTTSLYTVQHAKDIENEFMDRVKERMGKLGMPFADTDPSETEEEFFGADPILFIDGEAVQAKSKKLPKHLQEFIDMTRSAAEEDVAMDDIFARDGHSDGNGGLNGIWAPGQRHQLHNQSSGDESVESGSPQKPQAQEARAAAAADGVRENQQQQHQNSPPPPPVWTPRSAGSSPTAERKEFRPVNFESPTLPRKNRPQSEGSATAAAAPPETPPPWKVPDSSTDVGVSLSSTLDRRLTSSQSAPVTGFSDLSTTVTPRLPRAQNPTITLLQKAREGQLPRGASYIDQPQSNVVPKRRKDDRPPLIGPGEILYQVKSEYTSESDNEKPKKMADLGPRKFEGIGPTTKDGMPIVLRSEVKDDSQARWYKRMYDTIHRQRNDARYPYNTALSGGYLSEPEPGAYDSDVNVTDAKYATLDRRRLQSDSRNKENDFQRITYTMPRSTNKYSTTTSSSSIKHSQDVYHNQPGRIEDYVPGHSSISEKEAKEWWDEVMDIFDGWLDDHSALPSYNDMLTRAITRSHLEKQKHVPSRSFMSHALKESGYESDSTLIFRRRDDTAQQISPSEQKLAYKSIQKGGEVPLHGLRKPAPERPKDDTEIEYFPISPTLTRIRVHKSKKPDDTMRCYPVTSIPNHPTQVFANYKRTAPSAVSSSCQGNIPKPPPMPLGAAAAPSPPRRQSSRNNSTLRLISNMKITTSSSGRMPKVKRHETCFISSTPAGLGQGRSNIKYLRDRISCKLGSPPAKKKAVTVTVDAEAGKARHSVSRSFTTGPAPVVRANITSTLRANPETRSSPNRGQTKPGMGSFSSQGRPDRPSMGDPCCSRRSLSVSPVRKMCKTCQQRNDAAKLKLAERTKSLERTFGTEKRKLELTLPKAQPVLRSSRSSELTSPREVQKASQGAIKKTTSALLSSVRNGLQRSASAEDRALPVTVTYSEQGKQLLQRNDRPGASSPRRSAQVKRTVSPSISEKSRSSSQLSVSSKPSPKKKLANSKTDSTTSPAARASDRSVVDRATALDKKLKKAKKEQLNGEIAKKDKKNGKGKENRVKEKTIRKCAGRAVGSEVVKKLKDINKNVIDKVDSPSQIPVITLDDIKHKRNEVQSDSFFQHLLLRDVPSPTPSMSSRSSWLSERTRMLNRSYSNRSYTQPTPGALQVYLSHTRPVSDSKFRSLDRELIRSRSASPKSVTWNMEDELRHGPVTRIRDRDEADEALHERSSSLPPKIIFTETSRPISPATYSRTIRPVEPSSIVVSPSSRRIVSSRNYVRSVEGIHGIKRTIRTRSAGDAEKFERARRLGSQSPTLTQSTSSLNLSQITDPQEYQAYVSELLHSSKKSERFKELNDFYASLERLGQLEQTTLSTSLRPRRRYEDEIIDYDRWKEVRTRERAEKELTSLYVKLKNDQREKGFLFRPKDVDSYRWRRDYDRGLRVKEKSVENIKVHFEQLKDKDTEIEAGRRRDIEYMKDHYKPLWRGSSVANLATSMVEKRAHSEGRVSTITRYRKLDPETERLLTRGIGSRLWSSLSMDQVNALKNQLTEIYGNVPGKPPERMSASNEYTISVSEGKSPSLATNSTLTVRRNSTNDFMTQSERKPESFTMIHSPNITKSSSIGSLSNAKHTLSENEKKRLSMTLSQEVMERVANPKKYKTALSLVLAKETRGAVAAADANIKQHPLLSESTSSPRTCYSLEVSEDDSQFKQVKNGDFLLVIPKEQNGERKDDEENKVGEKRSSPTSLVRKVSSTSETESTDDSSRTVIFVGNKKQVQEKVEYFEKSAEPYTPVIYKPAEITPNEFGSEPIVTEIPQENGRKSHEKSLSSSQSFTNLKDLFGEQEMLKFASLPLAATRKITYVSPKKPKLRTESRKPTEYIYRSRSLSPDEIKYAKSNGSLLRYGKVRKLKNKFEYVEDFYSNRMTRRAPRRWSSNPELFKSQILIPGQEAGDVDWLRKKYEYPSITRRGRSRTRRGGVVSPVFLRAEDRFMPHIDIISKIASLYTAKQDQKREPPMSPREATESLGCPVGEVKKLREKFDSPERDISLLGHMFTSSPNVHELRDIAPYLAAQWTAHRYPSVEDNSRSLSSPEHSTSRESSLALLRRDRLRPKSTSPPRPRKRPPCSILKTTPYHKTHDIFANQFFDPTIHRPVSRYRPPASPDGVRRGTSWWPTTACSTSTTATGAAARPTVTFKEPEEPPLPPPKGQHNGTALTDPESPRRYVENEVTIHYRSPIRQEVKEHMSEDELNRRQAEAMRRIYQEERRRKYLQELQDMNSRRHTDNFTPSQKSPISLNRYDDFAFTGSPQVKPRPRSPEHRLVAKALYNFVGQSSRELTFRKGDIIYVRRQVDKNWYEGEHNAMIGLFPFNYVEIVPYEGIKSMARKASEGQARAKFNFIAQTHLELSLAKGELVVLTRKVDDNWFEGRIGSSKGIFPQSYVEVLIDPTDRPVTPVSSKPVASPAAHSLLLNGSSGGKQSMGSHSYTPSFAPAAQPSLTSSYHAKPVNVTTGSTYGSLNRSSKGNQPVNEALHIDTQSEPTPYRALYKYRPQNDDELELIEGDTVYVLEKCDDGWFVGSSQRTGAFGTFPGNYVERI